MTQEMREELSLMDKIIKDKKTFRIDLKKINKFLFVLIIILGVCYIAGVNDLSTKGFILQQLKKEANEAANENKNLEAESMTLGSYNNLNERIKLLGMVSAGKMDYVEGKEAVAKK